MDRAYERLKLSRTGPGGEILWVSLYNPAMRNALDEQMQVELLELVGALGSDDRLRCVILRGDGEKAFCSGGDITVFDTLNPLRLERYVVERGQALYKAIHALPVPVIAAVDGWCLAGGSEVALMCDFIYATQTARFGLPEINIGLLPGWGGVARLPSAVGSRRARELLMRGNFISGEEACNWGLVNRCFASPDDLYAAAQAVAEEIAQKPRTAVRLARNVVDMLGEQDDRALALERGAVALLISSPNAQEGVAAFKEKRRPQFTNDI